MTRLKVIYNNNSALWNLNIEAILKSHVYVWTEDFYESYNENDIHRSDILDRIAKDKGRDQTCSICLSDIEMGEVMFRSKWNHYFHSECIEILIFYKNSCPIWRSKAI